MKKLKTSVFISMIISFSSLAWGDILSSSNPSPVVVDSNKNVSIKFPDAVSVKDKNTVIKNWEIIKKTCPQCSIGGTYVNAPHTTAGSYNGTSVMVGANTTGDRLFGRKTTTGEGCFIAGTVNISIEKYNNLLEIERQYNALVK